MEAYAVAPALCLDLDGTIRHALHDPNDHIQDPHDIALYDGVEEVLWAWRNAGYLIAGISNQGGVGAGHKTREQVVEEIMATRALFQQDPFHTIQVCYAMPMHGKQSRFTYRSLSRKPDYGMLVRIEEAAAAECIVIDWNNSLMVGDRDDDRGCAENAEIKFAWANLFFNRYRIPGSSPWPPNVADPPRPVLTMRNFIIEGSLVADQRRYLLAKSLLDTGVAPDYSDAWRARLAAASAGPPAFHTGVDMGYPVADRNTLNVNLSSQLGPSLQTSAPTVFTPEELENSIGGTIDWAQPKEYLRMQSQVRFLRAKLHIPDIDMPIRRRTAPIDGELPIPADPGVMAELRFDGMTHQEALKTIHQIADQASAAAHGDRQPDPAITDEPPGDPS